ncbi:hypothetical protein HDU96_003048, partial [Phlyctochytrium bullatum]
AVHGLPAGEQPVGTPLQGHSDGEDSTLAEDFEMLPNTPFIAYQHNGLVKVKFINEIAGGKAFNVSSMKLIVLATAKIVWSIANLDNMDKDLVKWSAE